MTKTSAQTSRTVDLVQLINQLDIRRFHFQLLALCAGVVFMDGFDAQAIGYVAPTLSQAWHLAPGALGPVFGSGLFGIMLGALVGGICTLITAFAGNVQQLLIIRFITGRSSSSGASSRSSSRRSFGSHFQNPCAFFCSAIPTIRASTSSSKISRERRPARRAL